MTHLPSLVSAKVSSASEPTGVAALATSRLKSMNPSVHTPPPVAPSVLATNNNRIRINIE